MSQTDLLAALAPVAEALERLDVDYSVVGSVASSAHGIGRASVDADLVADLEPGHVARLVEALEPDYYVDRESAADAVARRSMFNVVHLATMLKVDVYVLTMRPFDRASFGRRRLGELGGERNFPVATPEDIVIHKLEWYRAGGETSDRQWADVIGVLRVQAGAIDLDYMRQWAAILGVSDLLDRALRDAS